MQNGDRVVYSKYAGTELQVQGADYVLLKVSDMTGGIHCTVCSAQCSASNVCQLALPVLQSNSNCVCDMDLSRRASG